MLYNTLLVDVVDIILVVLLTFILLYSGMMYFSQHISSSCSLLMILQQFSYSYNITMQVDNFFIIHVVVYLMILRIGQ